MVRTGCLEFDPPSAVMAGRLLRASRPSAHRPLKRRWAGHHKRAPGRHGNESVNVIAA